MKFVLAGPPAVPFGSIQPVHRILSPCWPRSPKRAWTAMSVVPDRGDVTLLEYDSRIVPAHLLTDADLQRITLLAPKRFASLQRVAAGWRIDTGPVVGAFYAGSHPARHPAEVPARRAAGVGVVEVRRRRPAASGGRTTQLGDGSAHEVSRLTCWHGSLRALCRSTPSTRSMTKATSPRMTCTNCSPMPVPIAVTALHGPWSSPVATRYDDTQGPGEWTRRTNGRDRDRGCGCFSRLT
jgi:hypothetical protein